MARRTTQQTPEAETPSPIALLGGEQLGGSYVLRLQVQEPLLLAFGRFRKGMPIPVPAGTYVYVGSAMNGLGRRLLRHMTRTGDKPAHTIRSHCLHEFQESGLIPPGSAPPSQKKLHWNVDHLLDQMEVEISHLLVLRTEQSLEEKLGRLLDQDPGTFSLASGLGANDISGNTHLLGVRAGDDWWAKTIHQISRLLSL